jgi:hypothetical protein
MFLNRSNNFYTNPLVSYNFYIYYIDLLNILKINSKNMMNKRKNKLYMI